MRTSVAFDILNALIDSLTVALPDRQVIDGLPSNASGKYTYPHLLFIGGSPNANSALDAKQSVAGTGGRMNEVGTVHMTAVSWNGQADLRAARTGVKATLAAVETYLRKNTGDPTLGGIIQGGYAYIGDGIELTQSQDKNGGRATLAFTVDYTARLS